VVVPAGSTGRASSDQAVHQLLMPLPRILGPKPDRPTQEGHDRESPIICAQAKPPQRRKVARKFFGFSVRHHRM